MNGMKKATISILSVLCTISVLLMILVLCNYRKEGEVFIPPAFDSNAIAGAPEPSQELGWSEIYQDGMNYRVGICGNIIINNGEADIYFSNMETNAVWLKLRIIDEKNSVIAETGLIKPNEYIKTIRFDDTVKNGEKIKLKIMAYAPETYYSEGSATLNTSIKIGD